MAGLVTGIEYLPQPFTHSHMWENALNLAKLGGLDLHAQAPLRRGRVTSRMGEVSGLLGYEDKNKQPTHVFLVEKDTWYPIRLQGEPSHMNFLVAYALLGENRQDLHFESEELLESVGLPPEGLLVRMVPPNLDWKTARRGY